MEETVGGLEVLGERNEEKDEEDEDEEMSWHEQRLLNFLFR